MNPLHELNQALAYIEEHLEGDLDLSEAARQALCSQDHFSRMFSTLAGLSLSEYVRRRRMTLAALDLQGDPSLRVVDLAVKYGYSSADAFSRAFQAVHGVLPSQAKEAPLKAYHRLSFQLTIQGAVEMQYRILSKDAFRVIGINKTVSLLYEGVNPEIQAMFESLEPALIERLKSYSNTDPKGLIQATINLHDNHDEGSLLDHYIGAASTLEPPDDLVTLEIPALEWAVFTCRGPFPKTMQDIWARIYTEWFPSSGYQYARGPSLVWCEHREITDPNFHNEIWVPVLAPSS